jgi:hypothetical protein
VKAITRYKKKTAHQNLEKIARNTSEKLREKAVTLLEERKR